MSTQPKKMRIGEFLHEQGVISPSQIMLILNHSKKSGKRFVEAGLELKIIHPEKLAESFAPGFKGHLYMLNPSYIQVPRLKYMTPEIMLKWGVIALGYQRETQRLETPSRRKILHFGLLNPQEYRSFKSGLEDRSSQEKRVRLFRDASTSQILVDQLLEALESQFGITEEMIRTFDPMALHPLIRSYLRIETYPIARAA